MPSTCGPIRLLVSKARNHASCIQLNQDSFNIALSHVGFPVEQFCDSGPKLSRRRPIQQLPHNRRSTGKNMCVTGARVGYHDITVDHNPVG